MRAAAILTAFVMVLSAATANGQVRILQTNSGGDNVHLIDPVTNKVVGEITGLPANHGAQGSPDGTRIYVSVEGNNSFAVVDAKTLKVIKSIPLTGRPNNITVSKDGKKVYVAIAALPGAVEVIDTTSLTSVKTIPTRGAEHNVYVTPDGKYLVAGSVGGRNLTVIDTATDQTAWSIFDQGVRPIAFDTNPDGSTRNMYVELSNHHGFVVVDFNARKEIARVTLPDVAPELRNKGQINAAPAHGIGVTPDQKLLFVCSRLNSHVYVYSLPDLKLAADIEVGHDPDWITFSPDGKTAYVASAGTNSISVVDIAQKKQVGKIDVGKVPKRNSTMMLNAK
jgi:YVTN family beta-propeller protein